MLDYFFWGVVFWLMILTIPTMAMIDYYLFRKWGKCEKCGAPPHHSVWYQACVLETLLFLAGLGIGMLLGRP